MPWRQRRTDEGKGRLTDDGSSLFPCVFRKHQQTNLTLLPPSSRTLSAAPARLLAHQLPFYPTLADDPLVRLQPPTSEAPAEPTLVEVVLTETVCRTVLGSFHSFPAVVPGQPDAEDATMGLNACLPAVRVGADFSLAVVGLGCCRRCHCLRARCFASRVTRQRVMGLAS